MRQQVLAWWTSLDGLNDEAESAGGGRGGAAARDSDDVARLGVHDLGGGVVGADLGQLLLDDSVLLEKRLLLVGREDLMEGDVLVVQDVEPADVGGGDLVAHKNT